MGAAPDCALVAVEIHRGQHVDHRERHRPEEWACGWVKTEIRRHGSPGAIVSKEGLVNIVTKFAAEMLRELCVYVVQCSFLFVSWRR